MYFFALTKVEGRSTHVHKWLASDRVVFAIVSATILGVLVETGIIRISGFVGIGLLEQSTIWMKINLSTR
jgi:hypothetical protein